MHVAAYTGLTSQTPVPPVRVVDRKDWAKVNIAKSTVRAALSICFMISISGPWRGANSGFTRTTLWVRN